MATTAAVADLRQQKSLLRQRAAGRGSKTTSSTQPSSQDVVGASHASDGGLPSVAFMPVADSATNELAAKEHSQSVATKKNQSKTTQQQKRKRSSNAAAVTTNASQPPEPASKNMKTKHPVPINCSTESLNTLAKVATETAAVAAPSTPTPSGTKKKRSKKEDPPPHHSFQEMFYELVLFKAKNGHFLVPASKTSGSSKPVTTAAPLSCWVTWLRSKRGQQSLTEDQRAALNQVGFESSLKYRQREAVVRWNQFYQKLIQYKNEHGNFDVSKETDAHLHRWVIQQRCRQSFTETYKSVEEYNAKFAEKRRQPARPSEFLPPEQKAQLDAIGFPWVLEGREYSKPAATPKKDWWTFRYQQLLEYRERFGHVKVPQHWPENKQLGKWVARQRCMYQYRQQGKPNPLNEKRIAILENIGFDWGQNRPNGRERWRREREQRQQHQQDQTDA